MRQKHTHSVELQPESITLLGELGEGEFGMVHKGEWEGSPQGPLQVAVKSLRRQEEESRYKLLKEAAIMGQFNHPYVVKLYGVIDQPNKVNCVLVQFAIVHSIYYVLLNLHVTLYAYMMLQLHIISAQLGDADHGIPL